MALYLSASGIGKITIIDHDDVELSNLQRQILFNPSDVGKNKAYVVAKKQILTYVICLSNKYESR